MITDKSLDDVFQLRKSKTTTKRRLGITEAFVSETILFTITCGNSACERSAFAPPPWLCPWLCQLSQSRAEHRKSISLWTSATCLVPVPAATVKSLFSAPALIYFNPCRTSGAKRRTAVKRGRRLIFERQIVDLRL